jgi:hypothetical protein
MPGADWLLQKDEATAGQRTITFQLTSQGTTPLSTAPTSSTSSVAVSINGAAQIIPNAVISAVSAGAGVYKIVLNQSDLSVLGNHGIWWQGPFAQWLGVLQVVNTNPLSNLSNIAAKAYSGVTVGAGDYAAKDMTSALTVGVGIAAPSLVTVRLSALDYSSVVTVGAGIATPSKVTVQVSANNDKTGYGLAAGDYSSSVTVGVGIATPSKVTVRLEAQDYSSAVTVGAGIAAPSKLTVQLQSLDYTSKVTVGTGLLAASAIPAGAFQANSIDNVAVKAGVYSGVTVGTGDYGPKDMSSALTVGVGIAAPSLVTVQVQATSVVSANVQFINDVQILGDGSASSFHV